MLTQQAQFAADFARLSAKTDGMAEAIIGVTGIVGRLADAQERTDDQLRRTNEQLRRTDERLEETGEYVRTVESHLNVLIEMFERHLRDDHGRQIS